MTINKKYLWYAGAGLLAFIFGSLCIRALDLKNGYSFALGQLDTILSENVLLAKKANRERARLTEKIEYEAKKVTLLRDELFRKDANIGILTKRIMGLEAEYPTLPDDTAKIENLTAQIKIWKEQFNLSDAKCKDYEGIVFSLTEKYKLQVTISDTWRVQFEGEVKAGALKDDAITLLKRDLRIARLFGTAKTAGVLALGGYVLYNLIKK